MTKIREHQTTIAKVAAKLAEESERCAGDQYHNQDFEMAFTYAELSERLARAACYLAVSDFPDVNAKLKLLQDRLMVIDKEDSA